MRALRRNSGTATAAATAPAAPARIAARSAGDGRDGLRIRAASIGWAKWAGAAPRRAA